MTTVRHCRARFEHGKCFAQKLTAVNVLSGCTPLHVAAHYGNIKVANYLLSLGAKVNAKTKVPNCAKRSTHIYFCIFHSEQACTIYGPRELSQL